MARKLNKKKSSKAKKQHTPLSQHKKQGTVLKTPLSYLNVEQLNWERDVLPEFIWIASLAEVFGLYRFYTPYNNLLNVLDDFWPDDKSVPIGLVSDFAVIKENRRTEFLTIAKDLIDDYFYRPIGRILSFYPESPAFWLINQKNIERDGSLDPDIELSKLRSIVNKLLQGKDDFTSRVRAVPLNRYFKHNKLFLNEGLDVIDSLSKYPINCTEEEKFSVESFARTVTNTLVMEREDLKDLNWSKYFWRHNIDLLQCRTIELSVRGDRTIGLNESEDIFKKMEYNLRIIKDYLKDIKRFFKPDLYDPTKDEIFFGIFSRLTRLYCLLLEEPRFWAQDLGGIILRCLADSVITFCYLAQKGEPEEFKRFFDYGEGQQKLLMLHLQDNYQGERSIDGYSADGISKHMTGFYTELLDIELKNWTNKNTRNLAKEIGLEKQYHLVFSPSSNELHGSWLSLKNSNLSHCLEPLHRFHRLPSFADPPLLIRTVEIARELYEECISVAHEKLQYPNIKYELKKINFTKDD